MYEKRSNRNLHTQLVFQFSFSCLLISIIEAVSFSLSQVLGYLVLSGSADGMILFWDLETGECQVGIQAHEGPVFSLDYNGQQHFFSSGG